MIIKFTPLTVEIDISNGEDYEVLVCMRDEFDNLLFIEAKELNLHFTILDIIKPSTYNLELFYQIKPFSQKELHYVGDKITICSCEFGYIITLLTEELPTVQATVKNLTIRYKKEEK